MELEQEVRVGYASIRALYDITKDYIDVHIEDKKYTGKLEYLVKFQQLSEYLKQ